MGAQARRAGHGNCTRETRTPPARASALSERGIDFNRDTSLREAQNPRAANATHVAGLGRQPAALSAPDALDFGSVVLGGAGQRTLHVGNNGDETLTLSGVALSDPSGGAGAADSAAAAGAVFSVQESDCGGGKVLSGGESCDVTLAFRPLAAQPDQQAQLIVSTADGVQQPVGLTGSGLNQGALSISPAPGSAPDFGPLQIGASASETFVVTNPSAQPSGPLDIHADDDFAVTVADGDCQSGITSLVNGQSCSITVALTPTERGQHDGGLTVASALAGAVNQPLTGRGLSVPKLALARNDVDFGRVSTQTRVTQSLIVRNTGDQPVSPVQASIEGSPAFSLQNSCQGGLDPNASCNIEVDFLPTEATSYTAVLHLTSDPGGTTSALLSGQAFARGSLVLSAVEGSGDFGDVVLGTPSKKQFRVANPSSTASGRLTLTVSNPLFTLDAGDCNPPDGAGFANGASCTFNVTLTPSASGAIAAAAS